MRERLLTGGAILSLSARGTYRRMGFTIAETLAALVFVAIVIPVAVQGITLANRAGVIADRQRVAAQLADKLLAESVVTGSWLDGDQEADCGDDWPDYRYKLSSQAWETDTMDVVTVEVFFQVQGREHSVSMSTLVQEPQSGSSTTSTGGGTSS